MKIMLQILSVSMCVSINMSVINHLTVYKFRLITDLKGKSKVEFGSDFRTCDNKLTGF